MKSFATSKSSGRLKSLELQGDLHGADACESLALVREKMGRHDESEAFYKLAIEGYVAQFRSEHALSTLMNLETCLQDQGRGEDAAKLLDEYSFLYAELDEWKLDPTQLGLWTEEQSHTHSVRS